MTATGPTDLQVRADIYKIAKAYLETERGLRPPEHLERFLTPAEYRRHRKQPLEPRIRTGVLMLPDGTGLEFHARSELPSRVNGQPRVAVPLPEQLGLDGAGYLWGRPTDVCVLDVHRHVGWADVALVATLIRDGGLDPATAAARRGP